MLVWLLYANGRKPYLLSLGREGQREFASRVYRSTLENMDSLFWWHLHLHTLQVRCVVSIYAYLPYLCRVLILGAAYLAIRLCPTIHWSTSR